MIVEKVVQTPAFSGQPLLVVDDSPANIIAYRAVLEPLGREIVTATSGEEAVRLLGGRQFALLLIDVRMPGIDGFETVGMLRSGLHRATPVVFVTGNGDDAEMRRAYKFGAVDYLVKPVHPEVLRGKVQNLVALYELGLELERRAELLVEQQQKLIEADHAVRKRDMNIGIVAHDLRTPLFAITTAAAVLRKAPEPPAKVQAVAERIDRSARRMSLMIRDILDFARGSLGGGIPLARELVDLGPVCRSVAEEVGAAHADGSIEVEVAGDLRGSWDQARVEQAVSNLLANAVQHGRGNATLRLSGEDPRHIIVEVRNDGDPIPPEQMPRLFEAFGKGDRSPAGLGLGLFIVREIVRAHDGTIDVASAEGATRFTMRLPRGSGSSPGPDEPPEAEGPRATAPVASPSASS